jgi:hypothetical protein
MSFQAAVATWLAVHLLVRMPVGGRFGLNNEAVPVAIRLETGSGLDDIELSQSDGGELQFQCKTSVNLSASANTPLAKTIVQLVQWVADSQAAGRMRNPVSNAAVLAVKNAPAALDDLESGCRAFDLGGAWSETCSQRNRVERSALSIFESLAAGAWTAHRGAAPAHHNLAEAARIFHIARFAMEEGESDWREASRLLGRRLYGGEASGDAPLRDVMNIMEGLISSGAPANRDGLLRELRRLGHNDVGAPRFEADVAALRLATTRELARLAAHTYLPLPARLPIERESDAPLGAAILAGSTLVVGEPGAGKTGALVSAASAIAAAGHTVVFLSVDRFPGVAIEADLSSELGLTHPVVEVLAALPGSGRRVLIIDALDAARGGPSEPVFAKLIEDVGQRLAADWVVVASIRTFDLRNGRRFRQAFAGNPSDADHTEPGLSGVRHFVIPRLSESDLATAGAMAPELGALLASAPPRLKELLRNIFNLSLAAQLLGDGATAAAFGTIRNQSGLIDAYEDARLGTTQLQNAAGAAAKAMAVRRRLMVRKVAVGHDALDALIRTGVLTESGDLVSFAHHVLFDHVAGRFYLAWDDPDALLAQLEGNTSTAFLLAPALRFAVERLWRDDDPLRSRSWHLVTGTFSAASVDPVLATIALRVVVENIESEEDHAALSARVRASPAEPALAVLLGGLVRFAAMDIEAAGTVAPARAMAWARLAATLVATGERQLVDPARILLYALFEHADLEDVSVLDAFGQASRALLGLAWASTPPLAAASSSAIRFVGKSFASDLGASRALLDRILREPHFSEFADREARWLTEQILPITRVDSGFTVEIYRALYGQTITDSATSWFGGQPSRILSLTSSRKQDYEGCLWHLGTAMRQVLEISPDHGTRALIDGLIGKAAVEGHDSDDVPEHVNLGAVTVEFRGRDLEFNAWDEEGDGRVQDDDLLHHYVGFLRACNSEAFTASVAAASRDYATPLVWSRILGVGSERIAEVGDLLWPLIERPDLLENGATLRDAVRFVAAAWPTQTRAARARFEGMALDESRFTDSDDVDRWRHILGRILASLPAESLELEATRNLRNTLAAEDLLIENTPIYQFSSDWGSTGNFVHDELRRAGIDLDTGPHREILDASDALYELCKHTPTSSTASELAALWRAVMALLALIDAHPGVHDRLDRSAWGSVANAVERVASSSAYMPGMDGLPDLSTFFSILQRLSSSRYPEPRRVGA